MDDEEILLLSWRGGQSKSLSKFVTVPAVCFQQFFTTRANHRCTASICFKNVNTLSLKTNYVRSTFTIIILI